MHIQELGRETRGICTALIFDAQDEVIATLRAHARRAGIRAAHFTAIGAFSEATLAYFDMDRNEYLEIPVDEQVEVASLIGDVGVHDGETVIHAHCVLGRGDGSTIAGHLLRGRVQPTLELFLTAFDAELVRTVHEATGLALIQK